VDKTAKMLGNTRSVCRKYYIHPVLIEAYLEGSVLPPLPPHTWSPRASQPRAADGPRLRRHEADVLAFIRARLKPKTATDLSTEPDESELESVAV
jgi:DNA topoisomerase-1